MKRIDSFYVIPGYTFFYWGFTFPKKFNEDFKKFFDFKEGNLNKDIKIKINNKFHPAKIRLARINDSSGNTKNKWGKREVVQIFYDRE